jgi:serine/threonine protein kinase
MFDTEIGPVTKKSDVWALGCLLLELQTGKVPWEGDSPVQIMKKVSKSGKKLLIPTLPRSWQLLFYALEWLKQYGSISHLKH